MGLRFLDYKLGILVVSNSDYYSEKKVPKIKKKKLKLTVNKNCQFQSFENVTFEYFANNGTHCYRSP